MFLSTGPIKCTWFRSIQSKFKFWWPSLQVVNTNSSRVNTSSSRVNTSSSRVNTSSSRVDTKSLKYNTIHIPEGKYYKSFS